MIRRIATLTGLSCAIAGCLAVGIGALLMSLFRIGASEWHWRTLGVVGVVAALLIAGWAELPRCPDCGRPFWKARWCTCLRWLGPTPRRWEV